MNTYPFLIHTLPFALYLFNNQLSTLASLYIKCALIRVLPFLHILQFTVIPSKMLSYQFPFQNSTILQTLLTISPHSLLAFNRIRTRAKAWRRYNCVPHSPHLLRHKVIYYLYAGPFNLQFNSIDRDLLTIRSCIEVKLGHQALNQSLQKYSLQFASTQYNTMNYVTLLLSRQGQVSPGEGRKTKGGIMTSTSDANVNSDTPYRYYQLLCSLFFFSHKPIRRTNVYIFFLFSHREFIKS